MFQNISFGQFISVLANIIFPLLLFFQWSRNYSREQAVKNHILATHRMIGRIKDDNSENIIDSIDATLASLDARSPFLEWSKEKLKEIHLKLKKEEEKPIDETRIDLRA